MRRGKASPVSCDWAKPRGMSLLEVLLAVVILAGAIAVIGPLSSQGTMAGLRADNQSMAALYGESETDRLLAGDGLRAQGQWCPVYGAADWQSCYDLQPGPNPSVAILVVKVQRSGMSPEVWEFRRLVRRSLIAARGL